MSFPTYKEWMEECCEYASQYDEELHQAWKEFLEGTSMLYLQTLTDEETPSVEGLLEFMAENDIKDFSFPDFAKWCEDTYAGEFGDYQDFLYDSMRNEELLKGEIK